MRTQLVNEQSATKYPAPGGGPVAAAPCISREFFESEPARIFRRHWPNVGRVDDTPAPGDYFVRESTLWRVSIRVMRGSGGQWHWRYRRHVRGAHR